MFVVQGSRLAVDVVDDGAVMDGDDGSVVDGHDGGRDNVMRDDRCGMDYNGRAVDVVMLRRAEMQVETPFRSQFISMTNSQC